MIKTCRIAFSTGFDIVARVSEKSKAERKSGILKEREAL